MYDLLLTNVISDIIPIVKFRNFLQQSLSNNKEEHFSLIKTLSNFLSDCKYTVDPIQRGSIHGF